MNLFVLPQKMKRMPSPSGLSLYFSMECRKKSPETIKKKSTEIFSPLNLSERTGENPWKYATHREHKNLKSSTSPFLPDSFFVINTSDVDYFFVQVVGVSAMRRGYISRRPKSIANERMNFEMLE